MFKLNRNHHRVVLGIWLGLLVGGQLFTSWSAHSGASDDGIQMESLSCAPTVTCSGSTREGTVVIQKFSLTQDKISKYALKDVLNLSTELVGEPGSWKAKFTVKAEGGLVVNGSATEMTKMMSLDQSGRESTPFTFKIGKGDGTGPVRNYSLSCKSRVPTSLPKECLAKAPKSEEEDWGLSTEGADAPKSAMDGVSVRD